MSPSFFHGVEVSLLGFCSHRLGCGLVQGNSGRVLLVPHQTWGLSQWEAKVGLSTRLVLGSFFDEKNGPRAPGFLSLPWQRS